MKIGSEVIVVGFKTNNPEIESQYVRNEEFYILGFVGKKGILESSDNDKLYPHTVFFGDKAKIRRCRFSDFEIKEYVGLDNNA